MKGLKSPMVMENALLGSPIDLEAASSVELLVQRRLTEREMDSLTAFSDTFIPSINLNASNNDAVASFYEASASALDIPEIIGLSTAQRRRRMMNDSNCQEYDSIIAGELEANLIAMQEEMDLVKARGEETSRLYEERPYHVEEECRRIEVERRHDKKNREALNSRLMQIEQRLSNHSSRPPPSLYSRTLGTSSIRAHHGNSQTDPCTIPGEQPN